MEVKTKISRNFQQILAYSECTDFKAGAKSVISQNSIQSLTSKKLMTETLMEAIKQKVFEKHEFA